MALAFYVADALSTVLFLAVAASFLRIWRVVREPLELLVAAGFAFLAIGTSLVSASLYAPEPIVDRYEIVRLVAHTCGAGVLLAAYAIAGRRDRARPLLVVAWSGIALALATIVAAALSPAGRLSVENLLVEAHLLQFAAYVGCAALASRAYLRTHRTTDALVPIAFAAYAMSKWTWVMHDLTRSEDILPFIYAWRFVAAGMLLAAVWLPTRAPAADASAA